MLMSDVQKRDNVQKYMEHYGMGVGGQKAATELQAFQNHAESLGLLLNDEATAHVQKNLQKLYEEKGIAPELAHAMESAIGVIHEKKLAEQSPLAKLALTVAHADKTLGTDKQSLKDYFGALRSWAESSMENIVKQIGL